MSTSRRGLQFNLVFCRVAHTIRFSCSRPSLLFLRWRDTIERQHCRNRWDIVALPRVSESHAVCTNDPSLHITNLPRSFPTARSPPTSVCARDRIRPMSGGTHTHSLIYCIFPHMSVAVAYVLPHQEQCTALPLPEICNADNNTTDNSRVSHRRCIRVPYRNATSPCYTAPHFLAYLFINTNMCTLSCISEKFS
jgi:hypothetical protein